MTPYEVKNFELAVHKTEELYEFLKKEMPNEKMKLEYTISYAAQFKFSKLGQASIKFKRPYNNAVEIMAYMCGELDKPFIFLLWKFEKGHHHFNEEDMTESQICDKWSLLRKIKTWLGINEPKYEQLRLFDL